MQIKMDWLTFWVKDKPLNIKSWTRQAQRNFMRHVFIYTLVFSLTPQIIAAESSGNPRAVGDHGKARGLMQIQEATWKRYTKEPWSKAFDPKLNVQVGQKILRDIEARYGAKATPARVVFTYNTGRFCFGTLPSWTKHHPNKIYRSIFNG